MSPKSSGTTSIACTSAPASSARWAKTGPDSSSASRRETDVEIVRTAVRMAGRLPATPVPAAAAGLREQVHGPDLDALVEALDHVVHGEGRDGGRGERLHLHAGAGG